MSEWIIRGYDRQSERSVSVTTLHGVSREELQELVGADPDDPLFDAYPMTAEAMQVLVGAGKVVAPEPDVDYFLEYWGA